MKTLVACAVCLILGTGLGWYVKHRRAEREKTEIVGQMAEDGEASDREKALRAAMAIGSIESGDMEKAVELLSTPVAHYYTLYSGPGTKDQKRPETRAAIEQLARTNQVVAARIAEIASSAKLRTP